jgi:hypothetical protein
MGLQPTYRNESALLRFIDSKQDTRDFRGSATACYQKLPLNCRPEVMQDAAHTSRRLLFFAHAAGLLSSLVLSWMLATGPFFFTD